MGARGGGVARSGCLGGVSWSMAGWEWPPGGMAGWEGGVCVGGREAGRGFLAVYLSYLAV